MPPKDNYFPVGIVGGSVAGATAAITLAQQGIPYIIFEKFSGPRNKACGEGLSSISFCILEKLGLLGQVLENFPNQFNCYNISNCQSISKSISSNILDNISEDRSQKEIETIIFQRPVEHPRQSTYLGSRLFNRLSSFSANKELILHRRVNQSGIGIRRKDFDFFLLKEAQKFNNSIFCNQSVRSVVKRGNKFRVETDLSSFYFDYIILADGLNSALLPNVRRINKMGRYGLVTRVIGDLIPGRLDLRDRVSEEDYHETGGAIRIIVFKGYELFITNIGDNRLNFSFIGRKDSIQKLRRHDNFVSITKNLAEEGVLEWQESSLTNDIQGAGPFESYSKFFAANNLFLCGDRAATLDPSCGLGMSFGMASAYVAATSISEEYHNKTNNPSSAAAFGHAEKLYIERMRNIFPNYRRNSFLIRNFFAGISRHSLFKLATLLSGSVNRLMLNNEVKQLF